MIRLFALLLVFAVAGCAPKSIEEYHTAQSEEEITRLLNEREYQKAIFLVESKHGKFPDDKNIAFLLGQAYLGKVGFEPLLVASRVSAAQSFDSREARLLFPDCQTGRVKDVKGAALLCLIKRIYLHVPGADREEFTRARDLFRRAYPSPGESPEWVNILIGMVETASVIKRIGSVYVFVLDLDQNGGQGPRRSPTDEELQWLVRQLKRALTESAQALARADHSGKKISQFLTGSQEAELFQKVRASIVWAERLGLGTLFDLTRGNLVTPQDEIKYGPILDRLRKMLDEQNDAIKKL